MQRISRRENIFLGYAAQKSYESPSSLPRSPFRSSDVDFNDVFGGPPRRFSHHSSDGGMDSEETGLFRGLSREKPVFGEESSVIRSKPGQSNDFFDNIFRGENFSSSPKRDFVNSLPGSRVMSPSSSLPRVKSEPFGTTLPAQFSLPATLTKAMDYPTFAFGSAFRKKESTSNNGMTSPNSPLSRPSNCPSSLVNEISLRNEESSRGNLKDDSNITETPTDINEFHFSIYKWTSSRVPIVMPLRKRISSKSIEKDKFERCSSSKRRIKIDAVDELLPANACDTGTPSIAVNSESSKMECHIIKEEVLINPKPEFLEIKKIIVENVPDYTILSNKSEETRPNALPDISLSVETEKEVSMVIEEVHKPELKPLHSILSDEIERQGNEDIIMKVEGKENVGKTTEVSHSKVDARENVKKYDEKKINSNITEMNKPSVNGSPKIPGPPGGNLKRSGVRGKVKDIVKIFNHNTYTRNQSSRWDGKDIGAKVNKASVGITEMNTEMASPKANKIPDPSSVVDENAEKPEKPHSHVRSPNENKILDASFIVDENVEQPKKLHSYMKSKIHTISDIPSYQQEASPFSVSIPDDSKVTSGNIDDRFQVNYMIHELSNDQVKLTQTNEDLEATKALDAKILKWSNGKKGNIRSLLSTLQYVLWPESGWKPVPLVNIIEGSAVKRAYQRALFYLHPDKLQQKGATSHQKYMAQKVFDILQEAWDHFNSLGSI